MTQNYKISVEKSIELLPTQSRDNDGVTTMYVPLPVRTLRSIASSSDANLLSGLAGEKHKSVDLGYSSGINGNQEDEDDGGNIWISGSRKMKNEINNENHDLEIVNIRTCICLRVKEVEKEVANVDKTKRRRSQNLLSQPSREDITVLEMTKKIKYSCHFFLIDSVFQERNPDGNFSFFSSLFYFYFYFYFYSYSTFFYFTFMIVDDKFVRLIFIFDAFLYFIF